MARQVLPIAGAVIGSMIPVVGTQMGFVIGSIVGNLVDPINNKGPSIGDARAQTSQEGAYRPIVLGTGCVAGNIIHRGPRVLRTRKQRNGKGGPTTTTEHIFRTFAIRISEGQISGLLRIWESEKLVYDVRPESTIVAESNEYAQKFRFYDGSETQLPDPAIEAYMGAGNVNAYRGTCYIVFPDFELTDYGDTIPQYRFEISSTQSAPTWNGTWATINPSGMPGVYTVGMMIWSNHWNRWVLAKGAGRAVSGDGQAWTTYGSATVFNVAEHPVTNDLIFIGNDGVVYLSSNGGMSASSVGSGANITPNGHFKFIADRNGFYGFGQNRAYHVSGGGSSVSQGVVIAGLGSNPNWIFIPGFGYYVTGDESNSKVYRSLDGLSGWEHISTIPDNAIDLIYDEISGNVIATCGGGAIFVSQDECTSWSQSYFSHSGVNYDIAVALPNMRAIYVRGYGSTPNSLISTDGGITFSEMPNAQGSPWVGIGVRNDPTQMLGFSSNNAFRANIEYPVSDNTVAQVVSMLHERVGASSADVYPLADTVDGIVFADGYSAADAIRSLMPIYMFDAFEADVGSGYRINYRKRGGPVVRTLTIDDLVDEPEESVREDSLERPRVLHLAFQNPGIGYAAAKASPRRNSPDVKVVGEVSTSIPVTFVDPDEAWRRADVMLKVMWAEVAGKQELSISESLLDLAPTDPVGVVLRGQVRRMRIEKIEYSSGILKCELKADRQSAFTSNLTGVPLPAPEPPPPSIAGPTLGMQLDIPALTDNNDRLLYYDAGVGTLPAWGGYQLQRSIDGGSSYDDVHDIRWTSAAVIGQLVADVTDASEHYTDTTNVVRVQLLRDDDELESLTDQQFLSEAGSFALSWDDGGVRRWEILQYRDAEQDSEGVWELSTLLRGRLNTETVAHTSGAYFVLLDSVASVDAVGSMLGQDLTHRSISFGTSPESADTNTMTYTGQSQREWPVAHLILSQAGSTLTARAVPRHRFGTEDNPVRSANWSGYRWTATDGANTVSLDGLSDTQTFDVSSWSSPIIVSVSQINRITGAGPEVTEVIA